MTILPQSWWQTNKNDWYLMFFVIGSLLSAGFVFLFLPNLKVVSKEVESNEVASFLAMSLVLIPGLLLTHLFTRRNLYAIDRWLFPLVAMLTSLGIVFIYRLSPIDSYRQLSWLILGLALCLIFSKINCYFYHRYYMFFGILAVTLLGVTVGFGQESHGARNWLALGGVSWQPSELAKILMVLFTAGAVYRKKKLFLVNILWVLALIFLVLQKDLGTAFIFFGTWMAMHYIAEGEYKILLIAFLFMIIAAIGGYYVFPHFKARVLVWLNPWRDPSGSGYQIIQALYAYQEGGLLGTGLGSGYPWKIPAVTTDFIFAAIGEEMGLLGTVGVMMCFLLLVTRAYAVALKSSNSFLIMVSTGISTVLALEVLVIVAGVTKFIPMTGITLPFVSYGGSSLVTSLAMLGILLNAASRPVMGGIIHEKKNS